MAGPTIEALLTDMLNLMKRGGGLSSGGSSVGGTSKSSSYSDRFSSSFVKTTKDFSESIFETSQALTKYTKALKDSSASVTSQAIAYKNLGKSVGRLFEQLPNAQSDAVTEKILKQSGKFHTALLAGATSAQELGSIADKTTDAISNIGAALNINFAKDKLTVAHMNTIQKQMMVFEQLTTRGVAISAGAEKAGNEVIKASNKLKEASLAYSEAKKTGTIAEQAAAKAARTAASTALQNARTTFATFKNDLADATNNADTGVKNMAKASKTSAAYNIVLDQLSSATGGLIPKAATSGAALAIVASGAKKMADEFKKIAGAGLADHFFDIMGTSFKFGASQEAIIETMTKNRRDLMMLGKGEFTDNIGYASRSLRSLGLTGDDAWKAASAFHEVSVAAGVNVKDSVQYNDVMNKQISTFNTLRAVTGITATEFAAMNSEILSATDNQKLMLRYSATERTQFLDKINKTREELVLMGLSAQAAQKMTNAMLGFEKNKFKDRYEAGVKMMQAASITGVGGGQRAFAISRKNAKFRTAEETAFMSKFAGDLQAGMQQFGTAGIAQEVLMDTLDDGMNGAAKGLLEAGTELKLAADAQRGITPGQAQTEADKNKLRPATAGFFAAADSINRVLGLGFTSVVAGLTTLIALTAKNAGLSAFESVKDLFFSPKSMLGRIFGIIPTALKWLGLLGTVLAAGFSIFSDFNEIFNGGGFFNGLFKLIVSGLTPIISLVDSIASFFGFKSSIADWARSLVGLSTSVDKNTSTLKASEKKSTVHDSNQLVDMSAFNAQSARSVVNYAPVSGTEASAQNINKTATKQETTTKAEDTSVAEQKQSPSTTTTKTITLADVHEVLNKILSETIDGNKISEEMSGKINKPGFGALRSQHDLVQGTRAFSS